MHDIVLATMIPLASLIYLSLSFFFFVFILAVTMPLGLAFISSAATGISYEDGARRQWLEPCRDDYKCYHRKNRDAHRDAILRIY